MYILCFIIFFKLYQISIFDIAFLASSADSDKMLHSVVFH